MEKVIAKAKDFARVSELKLKIIEKEATKEALMTKLGKEVYKAYPEINLAAMGEIVEEAHKIEEEVKVLTDAINAIKGLQKCPVCGTLLKDDMKFCGQCGAKLEKEIVPEEPVEVPVEVPEEVAAEDVSVEE